MHEMGIASSIIDAVRNELGRYPGSTATRVGLRLGEFAGVDRESLSFCFDVLIRDSGLGSPTLDIEESPRGRELDIAYLEIEEP